MVDREVRAERASSTAQRTTASTASCSASERAPRGEGRVRRSLEVVDEPDRVDGPHLWSVKSGTKGMSSSASTTWRA